ncbi:MAG: ATP-binding protein [Myxococcales bacterium]|nr:ATP-binding protein [Myxococcales bacterium]
MTTRSADTLNALPGSTLRTTTGNWVDGDQFFGRDSELHQLRERLDAGDHILLSAMRRIGKTSLMRETIRRMKGEYRTVFVDLESCGDFTEAVAHLAAGMSKHVSVLSKIKSWFKDGVDNLDEVQIADLTVRLRDRIGAGWRDRGDEVLATMAAGSPRVVVFIDELPILLGKCLRTETGDVSADGRREVEQFMLWLRWNAQQHQGRLSFVFAGSIGIEPLLRSVGLSASLNNVVSVNLEPWDTETALSCWGALGRNYDLEIDYAAGERMAERLGVCIPYHVQLFFDRVRDDARRRKARTVTLTDVDRVYAERMLRAQGGQDLHHMEERLRLAIRKPLQALAFDLLTQAAVTPALTASAALELAGRRVPPDTTDAALREVFETLEHDGYLDLGPHGHVFLSHLLRDFWERRFRRGFRPAGVDGGGHS